MDSAEHGAGPESLVPECPACGGSDLVVKDHGGDAVFCCRDCGCGWRFELGYVWQVDRCRETSDSDDDPGDPEDAIA